MGRGARRDFTQLHVSESSFFNVVDLYLRLCMIQASAFDIYVLLRWMIHAKECNISGFRFAF